MLCFLGPNRLPFSFWCPFLAGLVSLGVSQTRVPRKGGGWRGWGGGWGVDSGFPLTLQKEGSQESKTPPAPRFSGRRLGAAACRQTAMGACRIGSRADRASAKLRGWACHDCWTPGSSPWCRLPNKNCTPQSKWPLNPKPKP